MSLVPVLAGARSTRHSTAPRRASGRVRSGGGDPSPRARAGSGTRPTGSALDVEGLRAVAVALVLAYHAGLGPSGGYLGVDVFFVVSGFVITTQILRDVERDGTLSLSTFYARRAKRLLPAAGLVLVTTAVLTWVLAPRTQRGVFGLDIAGAAGYVVNWVFAGRSVDYLAEDLEPSPVLHFWSLAVEEQFYLVWPLAILFILALRTRTGWSDLRTALATGLTLLIILPTFAWSLELTAEDPARAFFATTTRLWEMGIGALVSLGALHAGRLRTGVAAVLGWVGLSGLAVAGFTVTDATLWPGHAALLPTLSTAAVIVAGFRDGRAGVATLLGTRPMRWVGGMSYSLYLWHWPVLRTLEWTHGPLTRTTGSLAVVATVVPAYLSYRLVEDPLRRNPWLAQHPHRALSVGAVISTLCVLTGVGMWAATRSAADARGGRTAAEWASVSAPPATAHAADPPFFERLTPSPEGAPEDVPRLYAADCQTRVDEDEVRPCTGGDRGGSVTVAVVGDSKVAQWVPAIDRIARAHGWRVTVYSKSACPLVDATVSVEGRPNESCRRWGLEVLDRITGADRPDVVITSTLYSQALDATGHTTATAYRAALADTWQRLQDGGTRVIALSDTPSPSPDVGVVYECVANHPGDPDRCSWPYEQSPGSRALAAVAEQTGAGWVDMDPWVCPGGRCVGTYRNVLTYRQGSHITATFVDLLAAPLEPRLLRALG